MFHRVNVTLSWVYIVFLVVSRTLHRNCQTFRPYFLHTSRKALGMVKTQMLQDFLSCYIALGEKGNCHLLKM